MQLTLLEVVAITFGLGIVLLLAWLVPFMLLIYTIQQRYPGWYKRIGRPYSFLLASDFSVGQGGLRLRRHRAWWRYLRRVYADAPGAAPTAQACRRLAAVCRFGLRPFVLYGIMAVVLVLPLEGLLVVREVQLDRKTAPAAHNPKDDVTIPVTSAGHSADTGKDSGVDSSQPRTTDDGQAVYTGSGNTSTSTTGHAGAQPNPVGSSNLTRADLETVFASIAAPGQKRAQKQEACDQLIAQDPPASDTGPSGSICQEPNLFSYSAY